MQVCVCTCILACVLCVCCAVCVYVYMTISIVCPVPKQVASCKQELVKYMITRDPLIRALTCGVDVALFVLQGLTVEFKFFMF